MPPEIAISPAGRLFIEPVPPEGTAPDDPAAPAADARWTVRIEAAFAASSADGLLLLGAEAVGLRLPPSAAYWRDFGSSYLQRLCQTGTGTGENDTAAAPILPADPGELATLTLQAPPMRGGEFLTPDLLATLWRDLGELVARETASTGLRGLAQGPQSALAHGRPRHLPPRGKQTRRRAALRLHGDLRPPALRARQAAAPAARPRPPGIRRRQKQSRPRKPARARPARRREERARRGTLRDPAASSSRSPGRRRTRTASSRKSRCWRKAACSCACPIGGSAASPRARRCR